MTKFESGDRRSNRTRYIVLGVLARGPASGYDVARSVRDSTSYFWSEGFGQIYPTLKQLAAEGLVRPCGAADCADQASSGSRRRKILYTLTPDGARCLDDWLSTPYQPTVERNEMLLKVFFSGRLDPVVARQHFMQALEEAQAALKLLNELELNLAARLPDPGLRFFYQATIHYGLRAARAQEDWAQDMALALEGFVKQPERGRKPIKISGKTSTHD